MSKPIRIGTSGWSYEHWKGVYYPEDLPRRRWFDQYAGDFDTVEINNTFYQQPESTTFEEWHRRAPRTFLYAVKAHRYITHMKKLKDPEEPLRRFFDSIAPLKGNLGPLLYQLPPGWKKNLERLRQFAEHLPQRYEHVFEFRNREWLAEDTFALMEECNLSLCVHDILPRHPRRTTGPVVYVRLHGAGRRYSGNYPRERLRRWAGWIQDAAREKEVYIYFNNDANGYAVQNAKELQEMTSK